MGAKAVLDLVNSLFFLMYPCICWNLLVSRPAKRLAGRQKGYKT